jgi:CPA2 family monovalent cation:H+ antiporter-2
MAEHLELIFTLTGGLAAAVVFGLVTQRLRLSPIVGYLIAGIAVGPFTPGFVAHAEIAKQLAEVGVILLMFGVGLHFRLEELLAVRALALPGALLQIAATTAATALVARWLGWSTSAGVVFGLAVAVASTVVLMRVLIDHDALQTSPGHVAVGWLLVEDIFTILVLVLLPIVAGGVSAGGPAKVLLSLGVSLLKIVALVGFTWFLGKRTIPRVLRYVAKTGSRELFTLTVLVLALGIGVGSAELFGASMALGAFLAGLVIGQSEFGSRAADDALPMRDAFAVLFFVSMGMLLDPAQILPNAKLIVATAALVLLVKPLVTIALAIALRAGLEIAVTVAAALAQIGEFSFILAALGRRLGVLPPEATQTLVAVSILSITCSPLLFRWVPAVLRRFPRSGRFAAGAPLRSGRSTP